MTKYHHFVSSPSVPYIGFAHCVGRVLFLLGLSDDKSKNGECIVNRVYFVRPLLKNIYGGKHALYPT